MTKEQILDLYHKIGWKIIPLNGKVRFTKDEENFNIHKLFFTNKLHEYNWGVLTGKRSGIIVIDCDHADNEQVKSEGTRSVKTPNGFHYYFKAPPNGTKIQNGADIFKTKKEKGFAVDVRGEGGYVVLPPSEGYVWSNDNPIKELPNWLEEILINPPNKNVPRKLVADLPETGNRHSWFMSEIASCFAKGWSYDKVYNHFVTLNRGLDDPLPESGDQQQSLIPLIDRMYNMHERNQNKRERSKNNEHSSQLNTEIDGDTIINLSSYVEDYRHYLKSRGVQKAPEFTTGFKKLDDAVWGYNRGELYLLCGKPNAGKSLFMVVGSMANIKRKKRSLIFSTETSRAKFTNRILIYEYGIQSSHTRNGQFTSDEIVKIKDKAFKEFLNYNNLIICDDMSVTIDRIEKICRDNKPDIIFVDYFQRLNFANESHFEAQKVAKRLKNIARDFSIPVIVGTQVNGGLVWSREQQKLIERDITSSDVRTTQALWHEADVSIILNSRRNRETNQIAVKVEVDKARDADYCTFYLELDKKYLQYKPITREDYYTIV